jgi:hypothetical protein
MVRKRMAICGYPWLSSAISANTQMNKCYFALQFHKTFQISTDKPSSSFSTTIKDDLTSLLFYTLHTRAGSSEAVSSSNLKY